MSTRTIVLGPSSTDFEQRTLQFTMSDRPKPKRRVRTYPLVGDTWATKQGVRLTVTDAGEIHLTQPNRQITLRCACGATRVLSLRALLASYIFVKRAPRRRRRA